MAANCDLIYGMDISWNGLGVSIDEWDKGIEWGHPIIKRIREFSNKNNLTVLISSDEYDNISNLVVGIPLYQVREIKDREIECIEKAKSLFEETTKNGLLEKLKNELGQENDYEPDLHLVIEER